MIIQLSVPKVRRNPPLAFCISILKPNCLNATEAIQSSEKMLLHNTVLPTQSSAEKPQKPSKRRPCPVLSAVPKIWFLNVLAFRVKNYRFQKVRKCQLEIIKSSEFIEYTKTSKSADFGTKGNTADC